jgi:hypothetical protein
MVTYRHFVKQKLSDVLAGVIIKNVNMILSIKEDPKVVHI